MADKYREVLTFPSKCVGGTFEFPCELRAPRRAGVCPRTYRVCSAHAIPNTSRVSCVKSHKPGFRRVPTCVWDSHVHPRSLCPSRIIVHAAEYRRDIGVGFRHTFVHCKSIGTARRSRRIGRASQAFFAFLHLSCVVTLFPTTRCFSAFFLSYFSLRTIFAFLAPFSFRASFLRFLFYLYSCALVAVLLCFQIFYSCFLELFLFTAKSSHERYNLMNK